MKSNQPLIYIIFFLLMTSYSFGQNITLSKAYYIKAREAFEKNDFQQSIDYLNSSKIELGSTNPEIIYLELQSRFNLDRKDILVESLTQEFMDKADSNDKERIRNASMMAVEHRESLAAATKAEEDAYQNALTNSNIEIIRQFISNYPNNPKNDVLKSVIVQKEEQAYQSAIASDKIDKYEYYLQKFPTGKYQVEIANKLEVAEEKKAYDLILQNRDERSANTYLRNYPNGKYKKEAKDLLEEILFAEGNKYFNEGNLNLAEAKFDSYKDNLPEGKNIVIVNSKLEQIEKKLAKQKAINSRTTANYFMLTATTNSAYGFEFGRVSMKGLSTYFNMTGSADVFDLKFATAEYELPSIDDLPKDFKNPFLTSSLGFTFKVAYPVWFYFGGGIRYQEFYTTDSSDENIYVDVEESKNVTFFPEAGLKVKIGKAIVLKAGAQLMDKEISYQFGLGIQTRNWKK